MNSSRLFVLKSVGVGLVLATLAGCGGGEAEQPQTTDSWLTRAQEQLALGDLVAATNAVAQAAKLSPSATDVIELSGQLAYHTRDYAKTREAYTRLTSPENTAKIRSRGYAGLAVVDLAGMVGSSAEVSRAQARVNLLKALKLDSTNIAARYHLGRLYRDNYKYNEAALDQFELYLHLEKQDSERLARVQRGVITGLKNDIARATARRPGVETRNSAKCAAALKKGDEAVKRGHFKTARLRYDEAYKADVLSFPAALGLAQAWAKSDTSRAGQKEALKYYKIAAELRPSSKDTLMATGDLALKVNNTKTAIEAYSRALAARPNDATIVDALIRALKASDDTPAGEIAVYEDYLAFLKTR